MLLIPQDRDLILNLHQHLIHLLLSLFPTQNRFIAIVHSPTDSPKDRAIWASALYHQLLQKVIRLISINMKDSYPI